MDNKYKYNETMRIDNGVLDEIDLGEKTGIDEDTTRKIISLLLSEHKIEFVSNGVCNYRIKRK